MNIEQVSKSDIKESLSNIKPNINRLRLANGYSWKEVIDGSGLSQYNLDNILYKVAQIPSFATLFTIASFFDVSVKWLLVDREVMTALEFNNEYAIERKYFTDSILPTEKDRDILVGSQEKAVIQALRAMYRTVGEVSVRLNVDLNK